MVKKLKKIAQEQQQPSAAKLLDNPIAGNIKESAQQIWLAGMGAFSRAQAEGGKVFEALVSEGMKLQRKTQSMAEDRVSEVAGKMTAVAEGVTAKAGAQWDKLESIFEERVAKALGKLGVPSRGDIDALIERIDALSAKLGDKAPARKATGAKPVAPRKAAPAKSAAGGKMAGKVARKVTRKAGSLDAPAAASRRSRRASA